MTPHYSLHPVLLTDNAYALCIYISYAETLMKHLPLWLIASAECWPSSVSFLWSSWQICTQETDKINDHQELQRNLEPQRQNPPWSQRCKVKSDSWTIHCPGLSPSPESSLPHKRQPIGEDELMRLQPARWIQDLAANQFGSAIHCKRHFGTIPGDEGKAGERPLKSTVPLQKVCLSCCFLCSVVHNSLRNSTQKVSIKESFQKAFMWNSTITWLLLRIF